MSYIVEGDNGTMFEVTITDAAGPVDLTTATTIKARFIRANFSTFEKSLAVVDAVKGKCSVDMTSEDVVVAGKYSFQVNVAFSSGSRFSSDIHRFVVNPKL